MQFNVWMGIPEMQNYWENLSTRYERNELDKDELKDFKRLVKCLRQLKTNPRYPGLNTHEISSLSRKYGIKVWQSYLENNTPGAGRLYWVYGPSKSDITIVGIEPHPENSKKGTYDRIRLSSFPKVNKK